MSGTVVLIEAEYGRLVTSGQCFDALDLPSGAQRVRYAGNAYVMDSRNISAENFRGDWLCMIDDDHLYKPSMLKLLLRHFEDPAVDVVTPYLLKRTPPHGTMLYRTVDPSDPFNLASWAEIKPGVDEKGLIEVDGCGASFILIRRRVFRALGTPYFHHEGHFSEDLSFCCAARRAGFRIFCDLDLRVAHLITTGVWPYHDPVQGWGCTYLPAPTVGLAQETITSVMVQSAQIERRPMPQMELLPEEPPKPLQDGKFENGVVYALPED